MLFRETIDLGDRDLIWTLQTLWFEINGISYQPHLRKEKSPIRESLFSSTRLAWSESPLLRCKSPRGRVGLPEEEPPQVKGGKIPSARPGRVTLTPGRAKTLQPRSRMGKVRKASEGTRETSPNSQQPPLRSFSDRGPDLPPRGKKAGRPADRQGAPMAAGEGGARVGWLGPPETKPRCWGDWGGLLRRPCVPGGIARAREPRRIVRGCFSREDRHPSRLWVSHGDLSLATATALWDVNGGSFPRSRDLGGYPSPWQS